MLQWGFLHSFPIFSRGKGCVRSGSMAKLLITAADLMPHRDTFPHPRPSRSPCARCPHIPLTMVSPEVFPSLWDHWWQVCAGAWLWLQGRRHPGPGTCCCASVSQRWEKRSPCCLQHPSCANPPTQPGLTDTPGFKPSAARAGTLVNLECGHVTHCTPCFLTPQSFTSPATHTPPQFPLLPTRTSVDENHT